MSVLGKLSIFAFAISLDPLASLAQDIPPSLPDRPISSPYTWKETRVSSSDRAGYIRDVYGKTPGLLAALITSGAEAFIELGIQTEALRAVNRLTPTAAALLRATGQAGVLAEFPVYSIDYPEGHRRFFMHEGGDIIGAGSDWAVIDDLAGADIHPRLSPFPAGGKRDDKSFWLWYYFDKDGVLTVEPISTFGMENSRRMVQTDRALGRAEAAGGSEKALIDFAGKLVRENRELAARNSLAAVMDQLRRDGERRAAIDRALAEELRRQKRRADAAAGLGALSAILSTAAAAADWWKATTNEPVSEAMSSASTPQEVREQADILYMQSTSRVDNFRSQIGGIDVEVKRTRTNVLEVIRQDPNANWVPELRLRSP